MLVHSETSKQKNRHKNKKIKIVNGKKLRVRGERKYNTTTPNDFFRATGMPAGLALWYLGITCGTVAISSFLFDEIKLSKEFYDKIG